MPFVDQLKNVDTRTPQQIEFDASLASMHNAIKQYCTDDAKKKLNTSKGYIIKSIDPDLITLGHIYTCRSYLYRRISRDIPKFEIHFAASAKYRKLHRDTCLDTYLIIEKKEECLKYLNALYPLLKQDGFKSITLNLIECKNKYAVIKEEGLFKKTYYKELVETNEIIGYTIEFILTW